MRALRTYLPEDGAREIEAAAWNEGIDDAIRAAAEVCASEARKVRPSQPALGVVRGGVVTPTDQLALCDAAPEGHPCAVGACSARVPQPTALCPRHEELAREEPTAEEIATLARWGWRPRADGLWLDSQGKYRLSWREALHRIAADERRGDRP